MLSADRIFATEGSSLAETFEVISSGKTPEETDSVGSKSSGFALSAEAIWCKV